MINIFNFINDILFKKRGDLLDNIDAESEYNPYMINRWISMYSPQMSILINNTTNKYYSIFITKKDNYKFLVSFLPKSKPYRISYIKKGNKNADNAAQVRKMLAKNLELSEREINYYISSNNIDIERFKKICQ
jgi:hypothetical protein